MTLPTDPRARSLMRQALPGAIRETAENAADGQMPIRDAYLSVLGFPCLIRGPDGQMQRTKAVLRTAYNSLLTP